VDLFRIHIWPQGTLAGVGGHHELGGGEETDGPFSSPIWLQSPLGRVCGHRWAGEGEGLSSIVVVKVAGGGTRVTSLKKLAAI
jgi:hypothetical protein